MVGVAGEFGQEIVNLELVPVNVQPVVRKRVEEGVDERFVTVRAKKVSIRKSCESSDRKTHPQVQVLMKIRVLGG